jgi:hypothetical protein
MEIISLVVRSFFLSCSRFSSVFIEIVGRKSKIIINYIDIHL